MNSVPVARAIHVGVARYPIRCRCALFFNAENVVLFFSQTLFPTLHELFQRQT